MISQGYAYVLLPSHHRALKNGYAKRADVVLEQVLGRDLVKGEIAHHLDLNRLNDSPSNLEVKWRGPHQAEHVAENTLRGMYRNNGQHHDGLGRFAPKPSKP